jgi:hypothetical protein
MGGQRVDADGTGIGVWGSDRWRAAAVAWLDERLAATGRSRTGEVTQPHLRPWATVLRAPTDRGPVWLKAPGPYTVFEIRLYDLLHGVAPQRILDPIAIDVERGWMILPDGGVPLGVRVGDDRLVDALVEVMPAYARLQRDLVPHVDELLTRGVPDMRPEVMPARFDEALRAAGDYVADRGTAADRATYERLGAARDTFAVWCARLAAAPGTPSLDHNDLHPRNIFGGPRFYDWGDSAVAHPFTTMLVTLRSVRHQLGFTAGDDPRLSRVRDAYLESFTDLAPRTDLVDTLELACRVGKVIRSVVWDRTVAVMSDDEAGEYASAPFEWLATALEDAYLGDM